MSVAAFVRGTVLIAAAALAACGQKNEYAAPPPPKVTVAEPLQQDVTGYFDATGNAAAVNSVDLVARVAGIDDYNRLHQNELSRLPGVIRLETSFALRDVLEAKN